MKYLHSDWNLVKSSINVGCCCVAVIDGDDNLVCMKYYLRDFTPLRTFEVGQVMEK